MSRSAVVCQPAARHQKLLELNDQKNKFIGMAAHDLRNPLGNVSELSKYLLEELEVKREENQMDSSAY